MILELPIFAATEATTFTISASISAIRLWGNTNENTQGVKVCKSHVQAAFFQRVKDEKA